MKVKVWVKQEISIQKKDIPKLKEAVRERFGWKESDPVYLQDIVMQSMMDGVIPDVEGEDLQVDDKNATI